MPITRPLKADLSHQQKIADLLREASGKIRASHENMAGLYEIGAATIEAMADVIKAQETLIEQILDIVDELPG